MSFAFITYRNERKKEEEEKNKIVTMSAMNSRGEISEINLFFFFLTFFQVFFFYFHYYFPYQYFF